MVVKIIINVLINIAIPVNEELACIAPCQWIFCNAFIWQFVCEIVYQQIPWIHDQHIDFTGKCILRDPGAKILLVNLVRSFDTALKLVRAGTMSTADYFKILTTSKITVVMTYLSAGRIAEYSFRASEERFSCFPRYFP